eukprot:12194433-Ditylum_brightwellii.AAC.1
MSLDIVNICPSVRVKLIKKALNHYANNLPDEAKNTINQCMDIFQFGMKSTLIQFRGKYCVYHRAAKEGEVADEDVALKIGTYESAFLAYIVASYVFEQTKECFRVSKFRGMYCNGGLSIVNKLVGGDYLQFTTKLWQPPATDEMHLLVRKDKKEEGVRVIYDAKFPFLDMEMASTHPPPNNVQIHHKWIAHMACKTHLQLSNQQEYPN